MPTITVKMYEGRTDSQKAEITDVLSRELSRLIHRPLDAISVKFDELPIDENTPPGVLEALKKSQ